MTDGFEFTNLSKIHRDFSMGRLEKRLGPFRSLRDLQQGKQLSSIQGKFDRFERAFRMGNSPKVSTLKKGLKKSLSALSTAKKVHSAIDNLLSVSTPANPAFKIAKGIGKQIIKQLQYEQTRGRGL